MWILTYNYGINFLLHYLDDFRTLFCQNVNTCVEWSIPLCPDKLEGPSMCLTVLGVELDPMTLQAHLLWDRFGRIAVLLGSWSLGWHCTWRELGSLIGHLQHACKVVPHGRAFLQWMVGLL